MTFLVTAIVTLAPTEAELREDAALMERISRLSNELGQAPAPPARGSKSVTAGDRSAWDRPNPQR